MFPHLSQCRRPIENRNCPGPMTKRSVNPETLRALVFFLKTLPDGSLCGLKIRTPIPFVYEFDQCERDCDAHAVYSAPEHITRCLAPAALPGGPFGPFPAALSSSANALSTKLNARSADLASVGSSDSVSIRRIDFHARCKSTRARVFIPAGESVSVSIAPACAPGVSECAVFVGFSDTVRVPTG